MDGETSEGFNVDEFTDNFLVSEMVVLRVLVDEFVPSVTFMVCEIVPGVLAALNDGE